MSVYWSYTVAKSKMICSINLDLQSNKKLMLSDEYRGVKKKSIIAIQNEVEYQ